MVSVGEVPRRAPDRTAVLAGHPSEISRVCLAVWAVPVSQKVPLTHLVRPVTCRIFARRTCGDFLRHRLANGLASCPAVRGHKRERVILTWPW